VVVHVHECTADGNGQSGPTQSELPAFSDNRMTPPKPRLTAPVNGFAAWALSRLLDQHGANQLVALRQQVDLGRLDPAYLSELRSCWEAIREAAYQWLAWERWRRASLGAKTSAEGTRASPHPAETGTATAAEMLGVSTSRIRQMARSGEITGRKVGRVWLVSTASVKAYGSRGERQPGDKHRQPRF